MQIPILIEPIGQDRFRAEAPAPFSVSAEGSTTGEVVEKVRSQIEHKLTSGNQIVLLEMPLPEENPWIKYAGHLKNDPLFDEWQAAIEEYRRHRDAVDEPSE